MTKEKLSVSSISLSGSKDSRKETRRTLKNKLFWLYFQLNISLKLSGKSFNFVIARMGLSVLLKQEKYIVVVVFVQLIYLSLKKKIKTSSGAIIHGDFLFKANVLVQEEWYMLPNGQLTEPGGQRPESLSGFATHCPIHLDNMTMFLPLVTIWKLITSALGQEEFVRYDLL